MLTPTYINNRLDRLAVEREIIIRYANESGSRAWGLASTDSDYDVRFVYQRPREWYLQLERRKDMIGPIMELDGELDLVGWDLRKVMSHLANSNAGVIEWLYSPVVYRKEDGFWDALQELAKQYFQPRKVVAHYLGIAHSATKAGYNELADTWNLKKFFYYLRPILAADFVAAEGTSPPVAFADLLYRVDDAHLRGIIDELIAHKETVGEAHRTKIPQELTVYLKQFRDVVDAAQKSIPKRTVDLAVANATFRQLIGY